MVVMVGGEGVGGVGRGVEGGGGRGSRVVGRCGASWTGWYVELGCVRTSAPPWVGCAADVSLPSTMHAAGGGRAAAQNDSGKHLECDT